MALHWKARGTVDLGLGRPADFGGSRSPGDGPTEAGYHVMRSAFRIALVCLFLSVAAAPSVADVRVLAEAPNDVTGDPDEPHGTLSLDHRTAAHESAVRTNRTLLCARPPFSWSAILTWSRGLWLPRHPAPRR